MSMICLLASHGMSWCLRGARVPPAAGQQKRSLGDWIGNLAHRRGLPEIKFMTCGGVERELEKNIGLPCTCSLYEHDTQILESCVRRP